MILNQNKQLTLLLGIFFCITYTSIAQTDKSKRPSPPAQVSDTIKNTVITIDYSQPSVRERKIWDGLVPYGKVWRTGANEASWFEVSEDVKINGKELKAGKYGLFTIPGDNKWVIIFNEVWNQWGAYDYDKNKDVLRVKATPEESESFNEQFTITISDDGTVKLEWENVSVPFTVE